MSKKRKILYIDNEQDLKKIFVEIYEENFERLIRYAFSITKEKGLAEDVVSQVFTNLWDKRHRLNKIREVRFYLNTAVKNQAIKIMAKNAKLPALKISNKLTDHYTVADIIDPENLLMGKELKEILSKVFADLPPQAGKVYKLSQNEKSNEEISKEMGISKRTVENHHYIILKKLKEAISKYFKAED